MKDLQQKYLALYTLGLNENCEPFDCDICLEENIPPTKGVILKECLHTFCKYRYN